MGKRRQIDPRHVAVRLLKDSLAKVNKIRSIDGPAPELKEAYIIIVPNARFYLYRYPLGTITAVRVIGKGTKPRNGTRDTPASSIVCAGLNKLVSMTRKVKVRSHRNNRRQIENEQDDSFLKSAANEPLRRVVDWDAINNTDGDNLMRCQSDVRIMKTPKLYGEVCWIPRRNWDEESVNSVDGILTPRYDDGSGCFEVFDYAVPPEVKKPKVPTVTTATEDVRIPSMHHHEARALRDSLTLLHMHIRTEEEFTSRADISNELREQYAVFIDPRRLFGRSSFQGWAAGVHQIRLMLHPEVSAILKVTIEHLQT